MSVSDIWLLAKSREMLPGPVTDRDEQVSERADAVSGRIVSPNPRNLRASSSEPDLMVMEARERPDSLEYPTSPGRRFGPQQREVASRTAPVTEPMEDVMDLNPSENYESDFSPQASALQGYVNSRAIKPVGASQDARIGRAMGGRYRLEELIGRGGMGKVYRATQIPLNRSVAVKVLNPDFQKKDTQFVRRFFLEAASSARLTHPNTITVFDYGEDDTGELFIAMEYLRGYSLAEVIGREGPIKSSRVLHIAMQICRALREAHSKGIIHRDLKPGNILLLEEGDDGDFVKVLDFGLVKLFTPPEPLLHEMESVLYADDAPELTKAGMFLGSPKYMSPEQIQGLPLDPRTDIYALGVLMFQMVTLRPPFVGSSSVDTIYRHVNQPIPTFASLGVAAPQELERIIRQCLAKQREDRFGSMADLLTALKAIYVEPPPTSESNFELQSVPTSGSGFHERPMTRPRMGMSLVEDSAFGDPTGYAEQLAFSGADYDISGGQKGTFLAVGLSVLVAVFLSGALAYMTINQNAKLSQDAPLVEPVSSNEEKSLEDLPAGDFGLPPSASSPQPSKTKPKQK